MAKRDWKPKAESIPFSISTQSYPPWAQPPDRKSWSKMKLSISWPMINHDSPLIRQCKTNKEPVGDKLRYVGDAWEITRRNRKEAGETSGRHAKDKWEMWIKWKICGRHSGRQLGSTWETGARRDRSESTKFIVAVELWEVVRAMPYAPQTWFPKPVQPRSAYSKRQAKIEEND